MLLCAVVASGAWLSPANVLADEPDQDEEASEPATEPEEEERSDADDEPAGPPAPSFELALTTTLASYSKLAYSLAIPVVGETEGAITSTAFGPSANPVTLEFGYLLSSQFSVGVLLELGSTSTDTNSEQLGIDENQTLARFMVGPRATYLFSDSGAVRPFAMLAVGFTSAPQTDSADARSISFSGLQAMAGLGLHWFLAPSFSIDPALRAGWGVGSGKIDQSYEDSAGMPHDFKDVGATGTLLTGAVLLGASGWL
jgi:hypothetical protein